MPRRALHIGSAILQKRSLAFILHRLRMGLVASDSVCAKTRLQILLGALHGCGPEKLPSWRLRSVCALVASQRNRQLKQELSRRTPGLRRSSQNYRRLPV